MKNFSVSQKIKVLGLLLILSIFFVITITIYLNNKNVKDALIVNIAGKQRMITQKITKNIFFLYQNKSNDFIELDNAIDEFNYNLNTLKDGNVLLKISSSPTEKISEQISKVLLLWKSFEKNTKEFKSALLADDIKKLNYILKYISETNNNLLQEVDNVVTLYTTYIEEKNHFIKNFQYLAFMFLLIFAIYALIQLKQIESHAREFIEKYTKISTSDIGNLEPIEMNAEKEFAEMADNMNCFINRVNSVVGYSQNALEQSKMASEKLEDLNVEFGSIINELENKSDILKQLDISEDIAIESNESLHKTTKKLTKLKNQLDSLLQTCQEKN